MIIQKIKAWRYPCDTMLFSNDNDSHGSYWGIIPRWLCSTKKDLLRDECRCGGNCKPERITITVTKG